MSDLDELSMGIVYDMMVESRNDCYEYAYKATQEDIDRL